MIENCGSEVPASPKKGVAGPPNRSWEGLREVLGSWLLSRHKGWQLGWCPGGLDGVLEALEEVSGSSYEGSWADVGIRMV